MKAISVIGYHHTGKTTTVVALIKALVARGFTVSSIKDIHSENFHADKSGSNSDKHAKAGSDAVFARGLYDTALIFPRKLNLTEMSSHLCSDFLIIEGIKQAPTPKIVCAETTDQLDELLDDTTVAISGMIANELREYKGIPVYCLQKDLDALLYLLIDKSFTLLPDVETECCGECGMSCYQMAGEIVQGRAKRSDCLLDNHSGLSLKIDGKEIQIVPFVQRIIRDSIKSMVNNLKDVDPDGRIEITII